jgi:hypothetical protein
MLVDGNARAMTDDELVASPARGRRPRRHRRDDAHGRQGLPRRRRLRAAGIKVVMGGPHVTECPDEALGRDGGPRHADAVALGEADETWPLIVEDAARGELKEVYEPEHDAKGNDLKPSLQPYPHIPWETLDLDQFSLVPGFLRPLLSKLGGGWGKFHVVPIGDGARLPLRLRVLHRDGLLRRLDPLPHERVGRRRVAPAQGARAPRARADSGLLHRRQPRHQHQAHEVAAARHHRGGAQLPWVAQISANLLRDEELVDLIAESGGKWVFIGMESIDPANMADVNKNFSKPGEYGAVLERLARRNVYAITSFIFGMDNDTVGVAERTVAR